MEIQIVEALGNGAAFESSGRFAYSLHAGQQYLLYDLEVGAGCGMSRWN